MCEKCLNSYPIESEYSNNNDNTYVIKKIFENIKDEIDKLPLPAQNDILIEIKKYIIAQRQIEIEKRAKEIEEIKQSIQTLG